MQMEYPSLVPENMTVQDEAEDDYQVIRFCIFWQS